MSTPQEDKNHPTDSAEVELILETRRAPALREKLLRELDELEKSLRRFRRVVEVELPLRRVEDNG